MALQIVYGKSGTGKTEYCLRDIKTKINNKEKIFIVTPEQFSFTAEKRLLEILDTDSSINAEVLTFNRMAYRVLKEESNIEKKILSAYGKNMLTYNILLKEQKNLSFLGNSNENLEMILNFIDEFKKHGINNEKLMETVEKTDDILLKMKLKDLSLLYSKFNENISKNYVDDTDLLTILSYKLENSNMFKDTIIYIDEFSGFTFQEYEIILKLLKMAKDVYITTTVDEIYKADINIFYSNRVTINKILNIAKENNIEIKKPIELLNLYRPKNNELKHLYENIEKNTYIKFAEDTNNISIFLAKNIYSEIEYVAKNIIKLVKNNGYRYKDFSIITKNISQYSGIVKNIFYKYKIPVFIDEKKELSDNILIKYILSVLEIFANSWSFDSVFSYLKLGLTNLTLDEIYMIENYCIKCGIKGSKWYKNDWDIGIIDNEEKVILNNIRKKVSSSLLDFRENLDNAKTVKDITNALYNFLEKEQIKEKMLVKIENLEKLNFINLANDYYGSLKIVFDVLEEMNTLFGKEKISFKNYRELIKLGFKNNKLGKIPAVLDDVTVGDVDRSKSNKAKIVFIIGVNDGIFPSNNKSEGFLDDIDREKLKDIGIELAMTTKEQMYEEQFNIYKAFTIAEDKLFISYVSSDIEGKALRPAILINKIKRIFENIKFESDIVSNNSEFITPESTFDDLLFNLGNLQNNKQIDSIWFDIFNWYKQNPVWNTRISTAIKAFETKKEINLSKKTIDKLYGNTLHTTISRLEKYRKCAFSYFMQYGLKLKEQEGFEFRPLDTGSFMHDVIDEFFSYIIEEKIIIKEMEYNNFIPIIEKIMNEKLKLGRNYIFNSSPKFIVLTNRLKKVVLQSIEYIIYQLKNSNFNIIGTEVEFKENSKYSAIKVELNNGKKLEITGKIDRIDTANINEKQYVRIIDYKSSSRNVNIDEINEGLQLQLITYLDSITEKTNFLSAGILYFIFLDPLIEKNRNVSEEKIKEEIIKKFKMQGLIINDIDIVRNMDTKINTGYSDIIPVCIGSGNTIIESKSKVISYNDFEKLQNTARNILKQLSEEILSGNISVKPYKNKEIDSCKYCAYKIICGFVK